MIFTNGLIATQYVSIDKYVFLGSSCIRHWTTLKASQRPRMYLNKEIHIRIFFIQYINLNINTVKLFCISKNSFWRTDLVGHKVGNADFGAIQGVSVQNEKFKIMITVGLSRRLLRPAYEKIWWNSNGGLLVTC